MMKRILKGGARAAGALAMIVAVFVAACFFQFSRKLDRRFPMHPELASLRRIAAKPDVELGKRIYAIRNGCIECHGADLSGAKVIENGAMGSIYGANITPYKTRDLTDEDLIRAIRYGVHPTGRSLRFMPAFDFQGLNAGDLISLVAYIRSVPEVKREDHVNTYGPVLKVMSALGKMPVVFPAEAIDHGVGLAQKPQEGPTAEFGSYLARSCAGCHGEAYRGGPIPGGDPSWPPAANLRMGPRSGWTETAFVNVIRNGVSRRTGQSIRSPMPIEALRQMNDVEIKALWLYFSSLD